MIVQYGAEKEAIRKGNLMLMNQYTAQYEYYPTWLTQKTFDFVSHLKNLQINPTWGLEYEEYIDLLRPGYHVLRDGDCTAFNILPMIGFVGDDRAKKLVYYTCNECTYRTPIEHPNEPIYTYKIFDYYELASVYLEENSQKTFVSDGKTGDVLGRALIGGMIAGQFGALLASQTASQPTIREQTKRENITFSIQTSVPSFPAITLSFPVSKESEARSSIQISNPFIRTFYSHPFRMRPINTDRNYGTFLDCYVYRNTSIDQGRYKGFTYSTYFDDIKQILTYICQKLNAIVHQNTLHRAQANVSVENISERLQILQTLFRDGVISEAEFRKRREEILTHI